MSIKSARLEALAAEHAEIQRQRNIAISLPLVGAAIPFVPLPLTVAIAAGCAIWSLLLDRKEAEASTTDIWDAGYIEAPIPDCDFRRSTFLGKAIPWTEWKDRVDAITSTKGIATADDVRRELIDTYPSMIPFMLSDDIMTRHVALLAATGTGKTELLLAIIQQQIKKGAGLLLIEAKSDSDFSGSIYGMMEAAGRLDELLIINFEFPEMSHTYNPFFSGGVRATISTAMKLQANSKEEFWTDIARYSLTAAVLALKLQPGEPVFHIKDIIAVLSDFDLLLSFIRNIRVSDSIYHSDGVEWLHSYLRFWFDEEKQVWNLRGYKQLLQGLVSKLSAFAHSEYSSIVNTYSPDVDLKEAILQNKVVVLSMSSLADKDGVKLFGKLFISDLARAVGEIQLSKAKPLMMCPAIFDEYPSFMDESQVDLFQLARSANVPIIIAFQGVGFLQNISPAFVEMVLGNCWTHLYCDIRDAQTREFAVKLAGTMIKRFVQESSGSSTGQSYASEQSGLYTNDSEGASSSTGYKATREDILQPEDFASLDQGDGIIVAKSGTYRVRMPLVRNSFPNVHFKDMRLVRRPRRARSGVNAWQRFHEKNKAMLEKLTQG
ncbi:type IV secretory system conjugative DNA transfer family protein [Pseudomonas sp. On1]|uniref:type IV secretory system conjugative DNA transfer family protein n=1 Tax=Pseudomonas sp. On1 TaxID=3083258 RepID=UPI0029AF2321|nr:TraM recognition domain-containing protein [Pseudomonas sp. On1]MDX2309987.1 TraM recognition domain-containing protein [Pseudomonas sp. On1]